jgi:hypothetical protein
VYSILIVEVQRNLGDEYAACEHRDVEGLDKGFEHQRERPLTLSFRQTPGVASDSELKN